MKRIEELRMFERCIEMARRSTCKKMGFGAVLYDTAENRIVWESYNARIGALHGLCDPECIRMEIPSRTQSMVGECAHAEELCLWYALSNFRRMGYILAPELIFPTCVMFVAGVYPNGEAIWRTTDNKFTCVRCAMQMHRAGIRGVYTWCDRKWHFRSSTQALRNSLLYATQALFPEESR